MKIQTKLLCVWSTDQSNQTVIKSEEETIHTVSSETVDSTMVGTKKTKKAKAGKRSKAETKANARLHKYCAHLTRKRNYTLSDHVDHVLNSDGTSQNTSDPNTPVMTITCGDGVDLTCTVYAKKEKGSFKKTNITKAFSLSEGSLLNLLCMNDEKPRTLSCCNKEFPKGTLFKSFHDVKHFKGAVRIATVLCRGTKQVKVKADHRILLAGGSEKQNTKRIVFNGVIAKEYKDKAKPEYKSVWAAMDSPDAGGQVWEIFHQVESHLRTAINGWLEEKKQGDWKNYL